MSISSLFACAAEIFVAANDGRLDFYHNNSLAASSSSRMRLFRTVTVDQERIVGITAQSHKGGSLLAANAHDVDLHVVLKNGGYVVVALATGEILRFSCLPKKATEDSIDAVGWRMNATMGDSPQELFVLWASPDGVYECAVRDLELQNECTCETVLNLKSTSLEGVRLLSVGERSGLVCVGGVGESSVIVTMAGSSGRLPPTRVAVPFPLCSLQASSMGPPAPVRFACGGKTGELALFTLSGPANFDCFEGHWHHTPLSGLEFTADGRQLLTAGADSTLLSWEVNAGFSRRKILSGSRLSEGVTVAQGAAAGGVISAPVVAIIMNGSNSSNAVIVCANGQILSVSLTGRCILSSAERARWTDTTSLLTLPHLKRLVDDEDDERALKSGRSISDSIVAASAAQIVMWRGRRAVMVVCNGRGSGVLAGGSDSVRICEGNTLETLHTIHVAYNAEFSATRLQGKSGEFGAGARCGLTLAALADNGSLIVTYEHLTPLGLPSVLRFWVYKAELGTQRQELGGSYVNVQEIFSPQNDEILSLVIDESHAGSPRLFTMSRTAVKCWSMASLAAYEIGGQGGELAESARAVVIGTSAPTLKSFNKSAIGEASNKLPEVSTFSRIWKAVTSHTVPSGAASSLCVSADGSVLALADDSVHMFDISAMARGTSKSDSTAWTEVLTLTQNVTTAPLIDVDLSTTGDFICGRTRFDDGGHLFVWSLQNDGTWSLKNKSELLGVGFLENKVLVAALDGNDVLVNELEKKTLEKTSDSARWLLESAQRHKFPVAVTESPERLKKRFCAYVTVSLQCILQVGLGASSRKVLVLDHAGLRFLPCADLDEGFKKIDYSPLPATDKTTISTFFHTPTVPLASSREGESVDPEVDARDRRRAELLDKLLAGEAYSTPPLSTILHAFLHSD